MSETFTFKLNHYRWIKRKIYGYAYAPLGVGGPCLYSCDGDVYFAPDMANWRIVTEADFPIEVTR